MPQTHFFAKPIEGGRESRAYWAIRPQGEALIFVHGFRGSAISTWLQFPFLLQKDPKCSGCDLIFYGYDGVRTRATNSAHDLRAFVDRLFTDPLSVINPTLNRSGHRAPGFGYHRVILVAHSLGAVVSRQAILDAHRSGQTWASRTSLVLFAPAHMGANLLNLVADVVTGLAVPFGRLAVALAKYRWRVLQDLNPGARTLELLLEHTKAALAKGSTGHLVAKAVIHSDQDDVVEPLQFANDPPHTLIHGRSHSEVCKPLVVFTDPVKAVLRVL